MLTEQIIELELRGLGSLVVYVLRQVVIVVIKQNSKENLRVVYY